VTITDAVAVTITAPRANDRLVVDTQVDLTATFTDQVRNTTHTCEIDWGDGTPAEAGEIQEGIGAGACVSKHAYAAPGEYRIKVTVANAAGDSSRADVTIVVEPKGK
jgi:PKD repeat protein